MYSLRVYWRDTPLYVASLAPDSALGWQAVMPMSGKTADSIMEWAILVIVGQLPLVVALQH